jgi:hypothetical protein
MIRTEPHRSYATPTYTYFVTDNTPVDSLSVPPLTIDAMDLTDCSNFCTGYRLDVAGALQSPVFVNFVPAT